MTTTLFRTLAVSLSIVLAVVACGGSSPPRSSSAGQPCGTTSHCLDRLAGALEQLPPAQLQALGDAIRRELAVVASRPVTVNDVKIGGTGLEGDLRALATTFPSGLQGTIAAVNGFADGKQVPISIPIALLFIAAALIFVPGVFKDVIEKMFGPRGIDGAIASAEG
jgi:hypothetical protein